MGLLALAGALSGAGQGAAQALQTGQAFMNNKQLQDERMKWEGERDARAQEHLETLQKQAFAHAEGLEQQRLGGQIVRDTMADQRTKEAEARHIEQAHAEEARKQGEPYIQADVTAKARRTQLEIDAAKGNVQAQAELDTLTGKAKQGTESALFESGKPLREKQHEEALQVQKDAAQQLQDLQVDAAKNQAADPVYVHALKTLTQAKQTDLEKANADYARLKVQYYGRDRQEAIDKADATTAALVMRDATNEINHLTSQVTKAEVNGDMAEVQRLTQQIQEAQSTQRAARGRAAALSGITLPQSAKLAFNFGPFSQNAAEDALAAGAKQTGEEVTQAQIAAEERKRRGGLLGSVAPPDDRLNAY